MTYTFKLARRLAVSRSFGMAALTVFVLAPPDLSGQPAPFIGQAILYWMPSGILLVGIVLLLGVLGAAGLAVLLDWLRKLPSQLPFQIAIWMVLTSGVFARQVVSAPESLTGVPRVGHMSKDVQGDEGQLPRSVEDREDSRPVGSERLVSAALLGFCLLPPAWLILKRKNSPAGLVRLALIFSLGFLLYGTVIIDWLKRLL